MIVGQIIGGEYQRLIIRKKSDAEVSLGEILVFEPTGNQRNKKILLLVYDLSYGSQINQNNLELIAGMKIEDDADVRIMDSRLRSYELIQAKPILEIRDGSARSCKSLPDFFGEVRKIKADDLSFMKNYQDSLIIGHLRSGSELIGLPISLPGTAVLSHHILIAATTGKGKSNLTSCMLWSILDKDYAGVLVLDPHDEYYGRNGIGLKDHPKKNVVYYTPSNPPPGSRTLKINVSSLKPGHFNGALYLSDPQRQALYTYNKQYGSQWISAILLEKPLTGVKFFEDTLHVIKRKMLSLLDANVSNGLLSYSGVFTDDAGENTIEDICNSLEKAETVIIDTSSLSGPIEILVGSMISSEIFRKHRKHKLKGTLDKLPVVSVVIEEAPRVLGKDVLEKGSNIFSTIAREGRKFRIGLTAITQLPSLIPRQILANMNTKLILGLEMGPERQAIIESASHDLSSESKAIASLDTGELIIASNFAKFAIPLKAPLFFDMASARKEDEPKKGFSEIS